MKKAILLFATLFTISLATQAQDTCRVCKPYKWEAGLLIGANQNFTDVHSDVFYISQVRPMFGAFVRRHFGNYFALRGQVAFGKLAGNDMDEPNNRWDYRRLKFTTPLTEVGLSGELYPFGERKYFCDGTFKRNLTPYIFGGVAAVFTNPTVTVQPGGASPPIQRLLDEDRAELQKTAFAIPFGLGVKYNVAERWTVGLEAGYRYSFSDYLDGTSKSTTSLVTNVPKKDGYGMVNLLGSYRFGDKDTDKDGVVDRCDACINEKGLRKFQGCPDTDGDGIPDKDDACPTQAGPMALGGCPDTDGDGITDAEDACPTEPGSAALNGCPDSDGDGIADKDDACPKVAGVASGKGCPDRDSDGVADDKDKCPDLPGLQTNDGCPEGYVNGIAPGYRTLSGCMISKAELDELTFAAQGIEFQTGTSKLKTSSYKKLDRVCALLQRCPDSILNIVAYNDGSSSASNLRAAKLRSNAIYAYFIKKKCISKARLTYEGKGDEDPSTPYTTPDGKKTNTRIEFQLK